MVHKLENRAEKALMEAIGDASKAAALAESPSTYLKSQDIQIPAGHEAEFDRFFIANHSRVLRHAALHAKSGQLPVAAVSELQALAFPSFKCAACSVAAFGVAVTIVAVGVAGLAALSSGSPAVVALASFAGVSPAVALAFIVTLGAAVAKGVGEVVKAICGWTGAC